MSLDRITKIKAALATLSPTDLEVIDNSHLHVGHAGAKSGKGHFAVHITATCFHGQSRLQRHRTVFSAIGSLFDTDIHALEIVAKYPDEPAQPNTKA